MRFDIRDMEEAGVDGGSTGGAAAGTPAGTTTAPTGVTGGSATGAAEGDGQATGLEGATGANGEAAPKPYQPNLKYKVLKEEKEIPEWAKPFVTSPDLEKNFKDTFERADGVESLKQHRDVLINENTAMREQWAPVVQQTQTAMGFVQKKDYDSFFEYVGIPEVDVLKYALKRLQLRENPEALRQHEEQRTLAQQLQQTQAQLAEYQGGYQNLAVQTREEQLGQHLQRPEILSVVQSFEAKVGKPGAFRAEVVRRGQMYAMQQIDAPVEQVVQEVLQLISWQGQNTQGQQQDSGQNGQENRENPVAAAEPVPQSAKPVLPHLRGKGTSPVKKAAKSTDELRALGRQLQGR